MSNAILNLALQTAVRQVVADVRRDWRDADPVAAVTFVVETFSVNDLDADDPAYLAYVLVLSQTLWTVRGLAKRQWDEELAAKAATLNEACDVATSDGRRGWVENTPTLTPVGWVVSIRYAPQFRHCTASGGADYAVADVTKLDD